jgi:hypothetical protein
MSMDDTKNQIWSYGGGVQSAAIAALIVQGKLPTPDVAVIADTGREASSTWNYLASVIQPAVGFPIHIVPHSFDGTGYNTVDLWGGKKGETVLIPAFTSAGENGKKEGKLKKYCSGEWKAQPVRRWCREHGFDGGDLWIGFSVDEMERCRTFRAADKWRQTYPLIDLRMSRGDCIALVERMGWPAAPRSSCWMCPYHSDQEWQHLKKTAPKDFQRAVAFERGIQRRDPQAFLHRSLRPIDQVDLSAKPDLFAKPCASGWCFT